MSNMKTYKEKREDDKFNLIFGVVSSLVSVIGLGVISYQLLNLY